MGTVLTVNNINVYYGAIHAIKGISLDVNRGEIVTLIGANGAGKSTTLHTISGLLRSRTGDIEFLESSISHVPAHKIVSMGISHVPEGRRIFQGMTVEENLQMGAFVAKKDRIAHNLEYVYEQFPRLKERTNQIAGTLSGGEQQMLAMGRALMSDPELLMLDEPSMGLAPILVDQIFEIIKNLNKAGTTILLVAKNLQNPKRSRKHISAAKTADVYFPTINIHKNFTQGSGCAASLILMAVLLLQGNNSNLGGVGT